MSIVSMLIFWQYVRLMIHLILCVKFLSTSLCKSKWKVLAPFVIIVCCFYFINSYVIIKFFWDFILMIKKIICLIWFFSLYELFPPLASANNTGSLVNSFFEVKILIPFPFFAISSSPSVVYQQFLFHLLMVKWML